MGNQQIFRVEGKEITLTNLEKVLWPESGITKGELIQYHLQMAAYSLAHYEERCMTVTRYPNGIRESFFYQKNCPDYAPEWIVTEQVEGTNFLLVNDLATLVWLANQGSVELHPSTFRRTSKSEPSFAMIDLDPTEPTGFREAVEIAGYVKTVLDSLGLRGYPKTSGSTGIHIYIPLTPGHSFEQTASFVGFIGQSLEKYYPDKVTTERLVKNRHGVYVDHLQNGFHKTLAGVYSPRPHARAPISAPISWQELTQVHPYDFTIRTMPQRVAMKGDLFAPTLTDAQSLNGILAQIT